MMADFMLANPHEKEDYISKWLGLIRKSAIKRLEVLPTLRAKEIE
jgi:hypothetical protein